MCTILITTVIGITTYFCFQDEGTPQEEPPLKTASTRATEASSKLEAIMWRIDASTRAWERTETIERPNSLSDFRGAVIHLLPEQPLPVIHALVEGLPKDLDPGISKERCEILLSLASTGRQGSYKRYAKMLARPEEAKKLVREKRMEIAQHLKMLIAKRRVDAGTVGGLALLLDHAPLVVLTAAGGSRESRQHLSQKFKHWENRKMACLPPGLSTHETTLLLDMALKHDWVAHADLVAIRELQIVALLKMLPAHVRNRDRIRLLLDISESSSLAKDLAVLMDPQTPPSIARALYVDLQR